MEYDRARDPDKYAHVWGGGYVSNSEARVFRNWKIEEFDAPPDAIHRLGADWGFAVDPTVLVRCHIVGRKLYIDLRGLSDRLRNTRHAGPVHEHTRRPRSGL
jgi:phage terminase large subunit